MESIDGHPDELVAATIVVVRVEQASQRQRRDTRPPCTGQAGH